MYFVKYCSLLLFPKLLHVAVVHSCVPTNAWTEWSVSARSSSVLHAAGHHCLESHSTSSVFWGVYLSTHYFQFFLWECLKKRINYIHTHLNHSIMIILYWNMDLNKAYPFSSVPLHLFFITKTSLFSSPHQSLPHPSTSFYFIYVQQVYVVGRSKNTL